MSMTFSIIGATYHKVKPFADEPDYEVDEPDEGFFELNLANSNASAILKFLGEHKMAQESFGQWKGNEVEKMLRKIKKYRVSSEYVGTLVKPSEWKTPNWYEGGRDSEYIERKLNELEQLFQSAYDHKMDVMVA